MERRRQLNNEDFNNNQARPHPVAGFFMGETRMLTTNRLRRLLSYEPATGLFRWLVRPSNRVNIGDIAGTIDAAGYVVIKIAGQRYYANQLAVLYVTGERKGRVSAESEIGRTIVGGIYGLSELGVIAQAN